MQRISMKIEGMNCGHCVHAVTRALRSLEGAEVERVDLGSASLRYDPVCTGPEEIARVLEEEGYAVRELESTVS